MAEKCLTLFPEELKEPRAGPISPTVTANRYSKRGFTKYYSAAAKKTPSPPPTATTEDVGKETAGYLEKRYGRNLPLTAASFAKRSMRRRLAGVLLCDSVPECQETAGQDEDVSKTDVFLYPMGMSAIWSVHHLP
jgi:cystathionine gamma-synthase